MHLDSKGSYLAFLKQLLTTCLIFTVSLMAGLCRGYSSFLIIQLKADDSPMHLTMDENSWLATLGILPNPLGCVLVGIAMDKVGRKLCVVATHPMFLIGWLIIGFATNVYMLYIGIFITGLASGMTMCNAVYVAEISATKYRGFMLPFVMVFFTLGVLLCNIALYYIGWRLSAYLYAACCVLLFVPTLFLPESPSWLVGQRLEAKALQTLIRLRCNTAEAKQELDAAVEYHRRRRELNNNQRKTSLKDVAAHLYSCRKQLTWVASLYLLQQSTGFIAFISYNASIIEQLKIPVDVSLASLIYMYVLFLTTVVTPAVQYYFRRRSAMMAGSFICALFYLLASLYLTLFDSRPPDEKPYYRILLILIYASVISSNLCIISTTYAMPGEIFPDENRGLLMGVSGTTCYLFAAIVAKIFLFTMYTFGIAAVFWAFTVAYSLSIVFGYCMPETKGKTLNQIQVEYFQKAANNNNNNNQKTTVASTTATDTSF